MYNTSYKAAGVVTPPALAPEIDEGSWLLGSSTINLELDVEQTPGKPATTRFGTSLRRVSRLFDGGDTDGIEPLRCAT